MESLGVEGAPFSLEHFDQVCLSLHGKSGSVSVAAANDILTAFLKRSDAWFFTPQILDSPASAYAKFFAIQCLKRTVSERWDMLERDVQINLRSYLFEHICQWVSSDSLSAAIVNEADTVLTGIIAKEWPQRWPEVMDNLLSLAGTSKEICKNNLKIIGFISEQVMEFGKGELTSTRISQLSSALTSISPQIYQLIDNVITGKNGFSDVDINHTALDTLKSIIAWLDPHFIFETELPVNLCCTFLPMECYRNSVLSVFGEIASLENVDLKYVQIFPLIFSNVVDSLNEILSPVSSYLEFTLNNREFVKTLIFAISSFVINYGFAIEEAQKFDALELALIWMIEFMKIVDIDSFRSICELWGSIARRFYLEQKEDLHGFYNKFFPIVRRIMVSRMERPSEIIIYEDDTGNVVKEETRNTLTLELYKTMHNALIFLTNIDQVDTMDAILEKIPELQKNWNRDTLNVMCWSAGAISGALDSEYEKKFLIQIIHQLLNIKAINSQDDKAIIASCIMFICSQYPKFLVSNWMFLKTIINKLFEFMSSDMDGIKVMAVDTFHKISEKCRRSFVIAHPNEQVKFIFTIFQNLDTIFGSLSFDLIVSMFNSLSIIVSCADNDDKSLLIDELSNKLNGQLIPIQDINYQDVECLRTLLFLFKCNVVIANNFGQYYYSQFCKIYNYILNVIHDCCSFSNSLINELVGTEYELFKLLRDIQTYGFQIISTFVSKTNNMNSEPIKNMISLMLEFSKIYFEANPFTRVHEILNVYAIIFKKLKQTFTKNLPMLLDKVLIPSIQMISEDYENFFEFRISISNFILQIIKSCSMEFFNLPNEYIQIIQGCIEWGCEHPNVDICCLNLELELKFLNLMEKHANATFKNYFYTNFYDNLFLKMFYIMTDTIHKFAFTQQVNIFKKLLSIKADQNNPERIAALLFNQFQNRNNQFYLLVITRLSSLVNDQEQFRATMRDLLIEIKQYSEQDPDLFREEKLQKKKQIEEIENQVPGLKQQNQYDEIPYDETENLN